MAITSFGNPYAMHAHILRAERIAKRQALVAVLLVAALLIYSNAARMVTHRSYAIEPAQAATQVLQTKSAGAEASKTAPTPTPTSQPASAPAVANALATESCYPSAYTLPSAFDLANQPAGLTQVIDPVETYRIYGSTPTQLRGQIQSCAPKQPGSNGIAEFTAQTGYQITWRYDYADRGDSMCTLSNAKIGLHMAMVLPNWQPTATAENGLPARWQAFIAALTNHENGHIVLGQQYAGQMLNDLQNFPPTPCATIQPLVERVMLQNVNSLNTANDRYDGATNHGATQGAVLPQ